MKTYKQYSWYSKNSDAGFGCYPSKRAAIKDKNQAIENLSNDVELQMEKLTHNELIEGHCYEVLEHYGLPEESGIDL